MADEQDTIQRRLENVNDLFRMVMQGSIPIELLDIGVFKDQYGKSLSQLLAQVGIIEECFNVRIGEAVEGVRTYNQLIDGYRLEKVIESQKAEIGVNELRKDGEK